MLQIVPITIREAQRFVAMFHRHHKPPCGAKFAIAVAEAENIVGVVLVGRPVSRMLDDGWTLEVTRTCTTGARNANSMLYGAAWRTAHAMGYRQLITYTLAEESGASLRSAGWKCLGKAGGGTWNRKQRPRVDEHPTQEKLRWQVAD